MQWKVEIGVPVGLGSRGECKVRLGKVQNGSGLVWRAKVESDADKMGMVLGTWCPLVAKRCSKKVQ